MVFFSVVLYRLLSRVVIIPFKGPSIRAHTEEQRKAFSSLKLLKDAAASSIGYFVALGKLYRENGVFEVDELGQKLADLLPKCIGRTIKGYAHLIWFTEQVKLKHKLNTKITYVHTYSMYV